MIDEKKKTILLVEDEVILALAQKMVLEKYGYTTIIVNSGEKAVETVTSNHGIDLILMDIDLGNGMDGTEAAALILKNFDVPVVFCSSHTEPEIVEKTEKITSYGYVVKSSSNTVMDASIKMAFRLFEAKTNEKKNEEILHNNDIQFRKLLENVPDLVFQFTRKADGTYCVPIASEGIRNIFGCTPAVVIDDFAPIARVIHPDDVARVISDIEYSAEHLTYFTCEFRVHVPGKEIQWIYSRSAPEKLPDGSITWFGFNADITKRKLAEEKIKAILAEKELILKEVNHRIKNNMNAMKGILLLQAERMNDKAAITALEDASKRMDSMTILYDQLYQSSGFFELPIKKYLEPLIDAVLSNFPGGSSVKVEKHIEDFVVDTKRLQLLGIIIYELLTNSMKYAFIDKSKGIITISATLMEGLVTLTVQDNGVGISTSNDFENSTGFGLMLVHSLASQIATNVLLEKSDGTRFVLEFKL